MIRYVLQKEGKTGRDERLDSHTTGSYSRPEVPGSHGVGECVRTQGRLALETHVWGGALEVRCRAKPKLTRVLSEALAAKGPRKDEHHPGSFIKCTVTSSEKVSRGSLI